MMCAGGQVCLASGSGTRHPGENVVIKSQPMVTIMLPNQRLNLTMLCAAYGALLERKRGQSLRLNPDHVALKRDGKLLIAPIKNCKVDLGATAELDPNSLVTATGDWSKEKAAVTIKAVTGPEFVALDPANLCDFNVDALRFVFEGDNIQNPTVSECGRFEESPAYYGFGELHGGGWSLGLDDGDRLQVDRHYKTFSRIDALGEVVAHVTISAIVFDCEK